MIWERLYFGHLAGTSSYFDWLLVWSHLSGGSQSDSQRRPCTYFGWRPHRHVAYFIHLVFVFVTPGLSPLFEVCPHALSDHGHGPCRAIRS